MKKTKTILKPAKNTLTTQKESLPKPRPAMAILDGQLRIVFVRKLQKHQYGRDNPKCFVMNAVCSFTPGNKLGFTIKESSLMYI